MSTESVEITSAGIRRVLKKYTPERAISEFIWNGFDAKASIISVDFEMDSKEYDTYKSIIIRDNGEGICYEELSDKFRKFYESNKEKAGIDNSDLTRGKNGYGRFTFHKFARFAKWSTVYKKDDKDTFSYEIKISSDNLREYTPSNPQLSTKNKGTVVEFEGIHDEISKSFIEDTLKSYLRAEFAWYLELKEEHKLLINGEELDYTSIIAESDSFPIEVQLCNEILKMECKFIRWTDKLNDEYSRFYFLNTRLDLKNTKTTLLNKKGDSFWHSVIIVNDFFNCINQVSEEEDDNNLKLFDNPDERKAFRDLITKLNNYLKTKRRPFLRNQAEKLVLKYDEEKVFPEFGNNEWDKNRKANLENLVKEIYEVEPAVFMRLNKEQKRIFLELLNLIMDTGENESLLKIIDAVIQLDTKDRDEFAKILEKTRLDQVISTIKLISNRLLMLEALKNIVFNPNLRANERDHLQKFIEKHYWIFGEEYRLVCSEEVKFENALRKYIYILRGVDEKTYIEHPDKYKEMDLFLTGADFRGGKPHNVVVEIKNPSTVKVLKAKHMTQLEEYMDVILKEDCFNDQNEYWTFILIGQDYDDVLGRRVTDKSTGFVIKGDNYSLYVKKWSEIVNEVERRLKYLLEKLKFERTQLSESKNISDVMLKVTDK